VAYKPEGAFLNHNFRTTIITPGGNVLRAYPISGNLSDSVAADMLAAMGETNQAAKGGEEPKR